MSITPTSSHTYMFVCMCVCSLLWGCPSDLMEVWLMLAVRTWPDETSPIIAGKHTITQVRVLGCSDKKQIITQKGYRNE